MKVEIIKYSEIKPENLKNTFKEMTGNYLNLEKAMEKSVSIKEDLKKELPMNFYLDIKEWYEKVMSEIEQNNKRRELFLALISKEENLHLAGILILKKTENEKKICTIRVLKNFRNKGIGTKLLKKSIEYLETKTPLITLPEECYKGSFKFLLEKYSFKMTSKVVGVYRDNKVEYFFNEDK